MVEWRDDDDDDDDDHDIYVHDNDISLTRVRRRLYPLKCSCPNAGEHAIGAYCGPSPRDCFRIRVVPFGHLDEVHLSESR